MRSLLTAVALAGVTLLGQSCHSGSLGTDPASLVRPVVADRLIFGRSIPSGGTVSDAEWDQFLRDVVTPRFPDGLTVWKGNGQWLDPRGTLVREDSIAIEVFHEGGRKAELAIEEIAREYKRRFRQDAVLRVTGSAAMRLY